MALFDPKQLDLLEQGYQLSRQAKQAAQPAPQPTRGRGGTLTSLISEGGALGGAAVGAAAGSVVPVIGTAIGGILGAGLGAFGGRLAENKVRDDRWGVGDAAKEAALSSALAGLGPGFKAVKGAKAAIKSGGGLEDAIIGAKAGFNRAPGEKVANLGKELVSKSRGITPGTGKTSTRKGLSVKGAADLNKFLDGLGIKAGGPIKQLEETENYIAKMRDAQKAILATRNTPLPKNFATDIGKTLDRRFANRPGFAITQQFQDDLRKLGNIKDVKSLNAFKDDLDGMINYNRASATPDPNVERLYRALRGEINDRLGAIAPPLRDVNKTLSKLYDAEDYLQDATKRAASTSEAGASGFKIPILGNRLPGTVTQSARNTVGRALQGRAVQGSIKAGAITAPQLLGRVPGAVMGAAQSPQNTEMTNEMIPSTTTANTMPPAISNMSGLSQENTNMSTSPFAPQNLESAIQQILANGGTIDDAAKFVSLAGTVQKLQATGQSKPLTASQATRAAAANNALRDIPMITDAIESGKLGGLKAIPGSGTQIGRRILGTENLDAALFNIADNILRARTGAAAPEAEVRRFVETFLPSATDSVDAKRLKLERAIRELQGYVNPMEASADTLEEAILSQSGF